MRSRRWPHAVLWVVAATSRVAAQGAGSASEVVIGEPRDIPDWAAGPAKLMVTPFENHVPNGRALEWLVAEAPFEIAEKSEVVLGLDAIGGPLYVPGESVPAEPETVAAFGAKAGAAYVITGWFDRPSQDLRLDIVIWKLDGNTARVAGEAQRTGALTAYHKILGDTLGAAWSKAGVAVDLALGDRLSRALASDIYPVFMMGRGLGYFTGALAAMDPAEGKGPDLKAAEHDLERAVFLDPKLAEAQRLLGELYVALAPGDPKAAAKAAGKFNYALDLAPEDVASLRAAAFAAASNAKWEVALELFTKLVTRRPWDLEARFQLGAAMWQLGDVAGAQRQLEQVTAQQPDHLAARRVLVLIHASRNETRKLVAELEAIAVRAPGDLEIKGDLATAYGALGEWPKSATALEQVAQTRPSDGALAVRIGDAHRRTGDLDGALAWYMRAGRLAPESSLPGFATAQALYDAGRLGDANRAYTNLQKYVADLPAAEQALGVIALAQNRPDDAAWYLRRAAREAPRSLVTRQAVIAAELARKDSDAALAQLAPALAAWPDDGPLHYLAGIAHALAGDGAAAHDELAAALAASPGLPPAIAALGALDAGGAVALDWRPPIARPWGDGEALQAELDHYAVLATTMATVRVVYQGHVLAVLGALGLGPSARVKAGSVKSCPLVIAGAWAAAQQALARYQRLGVDLEASFRFIERHDEAGLAAGLLPNGRTAVALAKHSFRVALADAGELRAEWTRSLVPELRGVGCSDRLLAAAVADPSRYHVIEEDEPEAIPTQALPRAKPRTTFFVDNTGCADPVDVWIDGGLVGQVAPGRRSALVADGGQRTLCLLGPGAAQCGDRGTVRQVYLHDGWSVTMHCPK